MSSIHPLAPYVAVGAVGTALAFGWLNRRNIHNGLPLPPGPKALPLIGNLLDMPKEKDWETYRTWNERYGDVVYVEALGSKMIVLSSAAVINELLERRSAIYSDRPTTVMAGELLRLDFMMGVMPYGDVWRIARRLLHTHLHQGVASKYHLTQVMSARKLAKDILVAQQDVGTVSHVVRANFGRMVIKMTYGIDTEEIAREQLSLAEKVMEAFSLSLTPGHFMVDFLTFLKYVPAWFPGAGFKRYAQEIQGIHHRLRDSPIDIVKAGMADGTAPPSVAHAMLADDGNLPPEKSELDVIKDSTSTLYLAGSDTTVASVIDFFLAMLVYPDVQRKAQAEIDRVIGNNRLPEMDDAPQLPYVQGVVNECLRWLPVTPLAAPHATTRDDVYNGYFIPKGTIIVPYAWAILHNPKDYPDPEKFNPERYLTPDGKLDPFVRDPRAACFGFGRRICSGRFVADASLFAMVATLLATVDIVRAKDVDGKEIVPEVDVTSGILSYPKPFPWSVQPRSQHAEELLSHALTSQ